MKSLIPFFLSLAAFGQIKQISPDIKLTGTFDASGATVTYPANVVTSLPGTCTVGQVVVKSNATNTNQLYVCSATNTWTAQGGAGGGASVTVGAISAIPGTCTDGALYYANDAGINETSRLRVCRSNVFRQQAPAAGPTSTIAMDCTGDPCVMDTTANVPTIGNNQTITALWTFSQVPVLPAGTFKRACELHIWGTGTAGVLLDADDEAISCKNVFGVTETITGVTCYANAGSPTVTPILTGGGGTSILSGALTCGTASWAAGTLNGTPTLTSNSTIDANITSAGGTATNIRLIFTLTRGN